jgi:hypothetical protein
MSGAIPPLPSMPPWHGAQLKHRDNFTFTNAKCRKLLNCFTFVLRNEIFSDIVRRGAVLSVAKNWNLTVFQENFR